MMYLQSSFNNPFVLCLSKDEFNAHRSCFDKLSTNGLWNNIVGAAE